MGPPSAPHRFDHAPAGAARQPGLHSAGSDVPHVRMKLAWAALPLTLAGCAGTTTALHLAAGATPLCAGPPLGRVAVLLETVWRADQKEPEARREMAESAVREAVAGLA